MLLDVVRGTLLSFRADASEEGVWKAAEYYYYCWSMKKDGAVFFVVVVQLLSTPNRFRYLFFAGVAAGRKSYYWLSAAAMVA